MESKYKSYFLRNGTRIKKMQMNCIALRHFSADLRNKTVKQFFYSMSTKQVQFYSENHDYNDFNESLYD